ncbi:MAG: PEP-CTERM sorting domain-containing protein [Pirellulales bacterium]
MVGSFTISGGGIQYFGGIQAIPEPSSMLVLTGLVVGAGAFSRRRKLAA